MELEEALKLIEQQKKDIEAAKAAQESMQAKMDELLTETKKAKQKAKEEAEAAALAAQEKSKADGDYKALYEASEAERKKHQEEAQTLREQITNEKKSSEAAKIAARLSKDTARAQLLQEKIEARLKLTDDGLKVLDESGGLTVSSIDDLVSDISKKYDFLVDGSQASGGGAPGGGGGADIKNPFKKGEHFNLTKQAELLKTNPQQAEALKAAAQA